MPYSSDAQRRWAHTAAGKKALGGEAAVHEWDEATKGKDLPERVGKSADEIAKSIFISASSGMPKSQTTVPNPAKVGSTAVKTPKSKQLPGPGAKPSVFFKTEIEEFAHVKHPTLCKLRDFVMRKHRKT